MAENDEASGTPTQDPAPTDAERPRPVLPPDPASGATATPSQPILKSRWRDRAWSFRALLAVAAATFVIGGVLGGTIGALADDGDDHPGPGRHWMGPGGPAERIPPGWRNPHHFDDGSPRWQWNDGPQPPDDDLAPPYGGPSTPSQPSPSPSR